MISENILYKIIDNNKNKSTDINLDNLLDDIDAQLKDLNRDDILDPYDMNYYEYETYTVPDLMHILNYYSIPKRKMKKIDMIDAICAFEVMPENEEIVLRRQKLWEFMLELKNDDYLSKFISF